MTNNSFGEKFILTLVTNDLQVARSGNLAKIDRIGVDLERLNKSTRQSHWPTRISEHFIDDLRKLNSVVDKSKLFARINPLSQFSTDEIEEVIDAGASYVMLPYFKTAKEVEQFIRIVDERAYPIALLETTEAVVRINDILDVDGLNEIMLGLNDLRIGFGVNNHFEILSSPIIDKISDLICEAGMRICIGGVAPPTHSELPINPNWVLAQYPRLGATGAWLARATFGDALQLTDLDNEVSLIRQGLTKFASMGENELELMRKKLEQQARNLGLQERIL